MNMNKFPFEPVDTLTDERVPYYPVFVIPPDDDDDFSQHPHDFDNDPEPARYLGMDDEEYEEALKNEPPSELTPRSQR